VSIVLRRRPAAGTASRVAIIYRVTVHCCFDEISHSALMDRVRKRIGDRHVLGLVKAFLKAGIRIVVRRLAADVGRVAANLEGRTAMAPIRGDSSPRHSN
jgi:retron-type reverse transcriptase